MVHRFRCACTGLLAPLALTAMTTLAALTPGGASAQGQPRLYARVIVETTSVRSGPGVSFRRVHVAQRGDVFEVQARSTRGYWFQIVLPDGTRGWVLGDAVYNHEVSDEAASRGRFLPEIFAPPPLTSANGEVAIMFGSMGGGGLLAVRPSFLLDPAFGFEVTGGVAVASAGRLLFVTLGPVMNVFPSSPVVPFFSVAGGVTASSPNADTFLLQSGSIATASAGGGLRIGFRYRLTLRLEARAHVFFEPDRYVSQEEYSAGLTVFF